jgi:hypothetical protein
MNGARASAAPRQDYFPRGFTKPGQFLPAVPEAQGGGTNVAVFMKHNF